MNAETGLFGAHKSLDGDLSGEFIDKEQFIGLVVYHDELLLPLACVEEIIMPPRLTYVPYSQTLVEGVINLRGTIIPVINLRRILNHPRVGITQETRIIIMHDNTMRLGIVVDKITLVRALMPNEITREGLQNFHRTAEILVGLATNNNIVNGILDMAKIVHTVMGEKKTAA